jgi:hypothetical protein
VGILDRDVRRRIEAPRRVDHAPPADYQGMLDCARRAW